jgi:hypothetical protein
VFFDHMDIEWEYEREGFYLQDGQMYLPDFWLPDLDMWVEIKGKEPTTAELERCRMLRDGTGNDVAIFHGPPGEHQGAVYRDTEHIDVELAVSLVTDAVMDQYGTFGPWFKRVDIACDAAKSARFEHGEVPA